MQSADAVVGALALVSAAGTFLALRPFWRRPASTLDEERLRRLSLGDPSAPSGPRPDRYRPDAPAGPSPHLEGDFVGERMEALGWKGALHQWVEDLVDPDEGVRERAREALWTLGSDDVDAVPPLVLALDDERLADAAADVLSSLGENAVVALRDFGGGSQRAQELLEELT
ncbi:MAG: hypothetical protein AB7N76_11300 [Planctomycetota bacterium]